MRAKSVKLYLNPNDEDERRVLDYLRYSGTSITNAITRAVVFYLDAQDERSGKDGLPQAVRDTIRESVQGLAFSSADNCQNATEYEDEEPVSMLDFLDALESGVTFDEK